MPVIPQYDAKEQLDTSARGMPKPDFSTAESSALGNLGKAVQGLGQQGMAIAEQWSKRQEEQAAFSAGVQDDARRNELKATYAEVKQQMPEDGSGFYDTFLKKADEVSEKRFAAMPPAQQARYRERWQAERIAWGDQAAQDQAATGGNFAKVKVAELQEGLVAEIASNPRPEVADAALARGVDRIKSAPWLSNTEKGQMLRQWETTARITEAQARFTADPKGMREALGVVDQGASGFENALIKRESGGRPSIMNKFGFAGLYQFGAPRLQTIGVYTPGDGENLSQWNMSRKDAAGKWSGTFNVPGHPEVTTIDDFLASPDAQRAAFAKHTAEIDQQIGARGLTQYIGKTVGGVEITREGIIAMAHLGGIGGAEKALKGQGNAADANGSTVLSYAAMASQSGSAAQEGVGDPRYAAIPFAQRQRLVRAAEVEQRRDAQTVNALISNDLRSIEATGQGVDIPRERVARALGETGAANWEATRKRAEAVHSTLDGIDVLPPDDVERRVESLRPVPGSPTFADDEKTYDAARQRADDLMKKRDADPAAAVEKSPAVTAAKELARSNPQGGLAPVVEARLAAQEAIGVSEFSRRRLTAEEARSYAYAMRPLARGQAEASNQMEIIDGIVKQIGEKYGKHSRDVLREVLYTVTLKQDAADVLASAIQRYATTDSGPLVTTTEARRVQNERKVDAVTAINGGSPGGEVGAAMPSNERRPYSDALATLYTDPQRLLPFFVQKYGVDRVPSDLREAFSQEWPKPPKGFVAENSEGDTGTKPGGFGMRQGPR